jgi:hypothetical protein
VKKTVRFETKIREVNVNSLGHYYALYLRTQRSLGSPPHLYAFFSGTFMTVLCLRGCCGCF